MRLAFAIAGAVLTICLVAAAFKDVLREWRPIQAEYKSLAVEKADSDLTRSAAAGIEFGIKQQYLPELKRIDRCETCHMGITNPAMAGEAQPFAYHPGDLLKSHSPSKFGCTVCHAGQGRATDSIHAHATTIKAWEEPMLLGRFIESSCEKCHRGEKLEEAPVTADGKRIFDTKGCAGCHKVYGVGGALGPELTDLGKASPHIKHAVGENAERYLEETNHNYNLAFIMESIAEPAVQPADTKMPIYNLSEWEITALTIYIKSLSSDDFPSLYIPEAEHEEPAPDGETLFVRYCSACHGARGEGGLKVGRMGTALNNADFLSLASGDLIEGVINSGRNSHNKVMPAWGKTSGGLTNRQIELIIEYIAGWKPEPPSFEQAQAAVSGVEAGRDIYLRNCADCHGAGREGAIGPSLNSPQFHQAASDRLIYDTITLGRPGTAMLGWRSMSASQLGSLMKFMRADEQTGAGSINPGSGYAAQIYKSNCATCHGLNAEGAIGPSLNSPEFIGVADKRFLTATIAEGRRDSGMPSWSAFSKSTIDGLADYILSLSPPKYNRPLGRSSGDLVEGENLFRKICSSCHGVNGEGSTGPSIGAPEFLAAAGDKFLGAMIKYGRSNTEMRPMGNVAGTLVNLTDSQIGDIIAYLRKGLKHKIGQSIRGSVDAGREWFGRVCSSCHGAGGRGAIGPALANPNFLATASDGFLQATMALGRSATEMRPVTKHAGGLVELDRSRINDIIAFLRFTAGQPTEPALMAQGSFGDADNGEWWFEGVCAKCHNPRGIGSPAAPGLNDRNFLAHASDGFLAGTIIRGRSHTAMRSFGKHGDGIANLTSKEVRDIVTYIRSWVFPQIRFANKNSAAPISSVEH